MTRALARLTVALVLLSLVAGAAQARAAPSISGTDQDVWNAANPTPTYTITGTEARARLRWRLVGTRRSGSGRSPLVVSLPALPSGRYRLFAEQREPEVDGESTRSFRVDLLSPGITIQSPASGASYPLGEPVIAAYSCRGAVSCVGPAPSGTHLDTSRPGLASFTVTATDAAGNVGTLSHEYRVGPAAPVISVRPTTPASDAFPIFGWSAGTPGGTFRWQLLQGDVVVSEDDVLAERVQVGPLAPGTYAFRVRETDVAGSAGAFSAPEAFTVVAAPAPVSTVRGRLRPAIANAGRLVPSAGSRITTRRPLLRWRAVPGADLYNLQLFRLRDGRMAKVLSVFPSRARHRVGAGRLAAGGRYTWRVWPYRDGRYTPEPLAVSFFDVVPSVRLDARQLLVNQRISQAAVRRTNAIQPWLDAGIAAGDLRQAGLGASAFGEDVEVSGPALGPGTDADPRPIVSAASAGEPQGRGRVAVSRRQLRINQRIAQAAVRRVNGLRTRLADGLTGGDVRDGSIAADKLVPGVVITRARPAAPAQEPTLTPIAPSASGPPARIRLRARQLLVSQRISQAALRRANALVRKLERGLGTDDFRPGSIAAIDLAPELRR